MVGSPKSDPSKSTVGIAPTLKPQFDERHALGDMYSCPLALGQNMRPTSVRPNVAENEQILNDRDAIGLSIGNFPTENTPLVVSVNFT